LRRTRRTDQSHPQDERCGKIKAINYLQIFSERQADVNFFTPIRWNHAIEHATIHILSRMLPYSSMAGRSNRRGFYIYGDLPTETLRDAVQESIDRLLAGEHQLAIHPNCGTNMVSSAVLAAGATMLATTGTKRRGLPEQIPAGIMGALIGVVLGQVVGLRLQAKVTTGTGFKRARILEIQRKQVGKRVYHWIGISYD
jgi:hypothetical protein